MCTWLLWHLPGKQVFFNFISPEQLSKKSTRFRKIVNQGKMFSGSKLQLLCWLWYFMEALWSHFKWTGEKKNSKVYLQDFSYKRWDFRCSCWEVFHSPEDPHISAHSRYSSPGWIFRAGGTRGNRNQGERGLLPPEKVASQRFYSRCRLFQGKGSHKTYWLLNRRGFNPPVGEHGAPQTSSQKLLPEVSGPLSWVSNSISYGTCGFIFHLWSFKETRNVRSCTENSP